MESNSLPSLSPTLESKLSVFNLAKLHQDKLSAIKSYYSRDRRSVSLTIDRLGKGLPIFDKFLATIESEKYDIDHFLLDSEGRPIPDNVAVDITLLLIGFLSENQISIKTSVREFQADLETYGRCTTFFKSSIIQDAINKRKASDMRINSHAKAFKTLENAKQAVDNNFIENGRQRFFPENLDLTTLVSADQLDDAFGFAVCLATKTSGALRLSNLVRTTTHAEALKYTKHQKTKNPSQFVEKESYNSVGI